MLQLQGVWAHSKELQQEVLQLLQKKKGHIIKDYRIRPQNRSAHALHIVVQSNLVTTPLNQPAVTGSSSTLTPEHVQQMIVSTLCSWTSR